MALSHIPTKISQDNESAPKNIHDICITETHCKLWQHLFRVGTSWQANTGGGSPAAAGTAHNVHQDIPYLSM